MVILSKVKRALLYCTRIMSTHTKAICLLTDFTVLCAHFHCAVNNANASARYHYIDVPDIPGNNLASKICIQVSRFLECSILLQSVRVNTLQIATYCAHYTMLDLCNNLTIINSKLRGDIGKNYPLYFKQKFPCTLN